MQVHPTRDPMRVREFPKIPQRRFVEKSVRWGVMSFFLVILGRNSTRKNYGQLHYNRVLHKVSPILEKKGNLFASL